MPTPMSSARGEILSYHAPRTRAAWISLPPSRPFLNLSHLVVACSTFMNMARSVYGSANGEFPVETDYDGEQVLPTGDEKVIRCVTQLCVSAFFPFLSLPLLLLSHLSFALILV